MEYKVIETGTSTELNRQVKIHLELGWKPVGSHQVIVKHIQNRFSGLQHKDSISEMEYSQTMVKETSDIKEEIEPIIRMYGQGYIDNGECLSKIIEVLMLS
jgi:hypothetical protein